MTKLDENDLVEYQILASMANATGSFGALLGALFYAGLGFLIVFARLALLIGSLGSLFNSFFA